MNRLSGLEDLLVHVMRSNKPIHACECGEQRCFYMKLLQLRSSALSNVVLQSAFNRFAMLFVAPLYICFFESGVLVRRLPPQFKIQV